MSAGSPARTGPARGSTRRASCRVMACSGCHGPRPSCRARVVAADIAVHGSSGATGRRNRAPASPRRPAATAAGRPGRCGRPSWRRRRRGRRGHAPAGRSPSGPAGQSGRSPRCRTNWACSIRPAMPAASKASSATWLAASPIAWTAGTKPASRARTSSASSSASLTVSRPRPPCGYGSTQYAVRVLSEPSISTFSGPTLSSPVPAAHLLTRPHARGRGPVQVLRVDPRLHPEGAEAAGDPPQPHVAVPGHLEVHDPHHAAGGGLCAASRTQASTTASGSRPSSRVSANAGSSRSSPPASTATP